MLVDKIGGRICACLPLIKDTHAALESSKTQLHYVERIRGEDGKVRSCVTVDALTEPQPASRKYCNVIVRHASATRNGDARRAALLSVLSSPNLRLSLPQVVAFLSTSQSWISLR